MRAISLQRVGQKEPEKISNDDWKMMSADIDVCTDMWYIVTD